MIINKIDIKGLYGKYDFTWEMRKDINILAGDNGAYKSTILRIISEMCSTQENPLMPFVMSAEMTLSQDYRLIYRKGDVENPMVVDGAMLFCGKQRISHDDFRKECVCNNIATFDVPSKQKGVSALDSQMEKLESEYAYYLSDLSKQVSDMIKKKGNVDQNNFEAIYKQNDLFISIIDEPLETQAKVLTRIRANCNSFWTASS